jgi:hypothetical protein
MRLYKLALLILFAWTTVHAQSKIQNPESSQAKTVAAASASCSTLAPCSASVNIPWDSAGAPCGKPFWGTCSFIRFPITFTDVPAGRRVNITRLYGDAIAWASAPVTPGHHAGILWGGWSSTPQTANMLMDGNVQMGDSACPWYDQGSLSTGDFTVLFDRPNLNVPLASDNLFTVQLAQFLNDTGASIHVELTFVIVYTYIQ